MKRYERAVIVMGLILIIGVIYLIAATAINLEIGILLTTIICMFCATLKIMLE